MARHVIMFVLVFFWLSAKASEVSENLWTTGKIHVVLAVLITIFTGIIIFLIVLERKIKKLEQDLK